MEPIKKFDWGDLNIEAYNTLFAQLAESELSCIYKYYSYNSRDGEKEHINLPDRTGKHCRDSSNQRRKRQRTFKQVRKC